MDWLLVLATCETYCCVAVGGPCLHSHVEWDACVGIPTGMSVAVLGQLVCGIQPDLMFPDLGRYYTQVDPVSQPPQHFYPHPSA